MRPSSSQPELQTLLSRHGLSLHLEMSGSRGSNLISTQHLITWFSFICSEEVWRPKMKLIWVWRAYYLPNPFQIISKTNLAIPRTLGTGTPVCQCWSAWQYEKKVQAVTCLYHKAMWARATILTIFTCSSAVFGQCLISNHFMKGTGKFMCSRLHPFWLNRENMQSGKWYQKKTIDYDKAICTHFIFL